MARVIRLNPDLDLALLAVDIEDRRPYLPLGDSLSVPPLTELIVFGNAHVQPGEPGRLIMARVARNSKDDPLHIETDGDIEPGFSGGPAVEKSKGVVVGIVRGGYGRSATLLVRSEQLMEILIELGYRFE
jgi:S1-C subfamily serine protease